MCLLRGAFVHNRGGPVSYGKRLFMILWFCWVYRGLVIVKSPFALLHRFLWAVVGESFFNCLFFYSFSGVVLGLVHGRCVKSVGGVVVYFVFGLLKRWWGVRLHFRYGPVRVLYWDLFGLHGDRLYRIRFEGLLLVFVNDFDAVARLNALGLRLWLCGSWIGDLAVTIFASARHLWGHRRHPAYRVGLLAHFVEGTLRALVVWSHQDFAAARGWELRRRLFVAQRRWSPLGGYNLRFFRLTQPGHALLLHRAFV